MNSAIMKQEFSKCVGSYSVCRLAVDVGLPCGRRLPSLHSDRQVPVDALGRDGAQGAPALGRVPHRHEHDGQRPRCGRRMRTSSRKDARAGNHTAASEARMSETWGASDMRVYGGLRLGSELCGWMKGWMKVTKPARCRQKRPSSVCSVPPTILPFVLPSAAIT